mgnify:CR=1 FL=1
MPDMSLKLSDFRIPAMLTGALFSGLMIGSLARGGEDGPGMASAIPGNFLSRGNAAAEAGTDRASPAVEVSLRPRKRSGIVPMSIRHEIRTGTVPCMEQALTPQGKPVAYISRNCLWYSNIDQSVYPEECSTVFGGVDGGREVFDVRCLIRIGFPTPDRSSNG